jgi:hypothetical protein
VADGSTTAVVGTGGREEVGTAELVGAGAAVVGSTAGLAAVVGSTAGLAAVVGSTAGLGPAAVVGSTAGPAAVVGSTAGPAAVVGSTAGPAAVVVRRWFDCSGSQWRGLDDSGTGSGTRGGEGGGGGRNLHWRCSAAGC